MATQSSDVPAAAPGEGKEQAEECPWCAYMKKGPCRDVFVAWQACVDSVMDQAEGRKLAVDKCTGVTKPLFECMAANPGYYGPQLDDIEEPPANSSNNSSSRQDSRSDSKGQQPRTATAGAPQQPRAASAIAEGTKSASPAMAG